MHRIIIIACCSWFLTACTIHTGGTTTSPRIESELQQGKRYFENGYYKSAMRTLLPLACDGNAQAQYAVGYMYYYGDGVAQDTDVGYFWISRSARSNYPPAVNALKIISQEKGSNRLNDSTKKIYNISSQKGK